MSNTAVTVIVNRSYHEYICNEDWKCYRSEAYHDYRRKWYEYPKRQYLSDFPLHLDLESTNACNLKCVMCPRTIMVKDNTMPKIGLMDFDFFKYLIDQGASHGLASVKFNYLGEPLLHPRIVDMVAYAKSKGIIDVMFNTNATLLSREVSEALLDAGLDGLFVSIDSAFKEKYEAIRVGADYEQVVENIKTFARLKKVKGKHHVQTRVSMVLMQDNQEELELFKEQWSNIVDAVGCGYYVNHDDPNANKRHVHIGSPTSNYCCDQLWQRLFVMWDGECTPCCVDEKRELKVGDARESSLQQLWLESAVYKKLREYHSSGRYYEIDRCRRCDVTRFTE